MRLLPAAIVVACLLEIIGVTRAADPLTAEPKPVGQGSEKEATGLAEATRLATRGEFDKAIELASQAIAAEPKDAAARRLRAMLYVQQRKHAEAVADLNVAIEIEPKSAALYDARGSELLVLGKFKEAIADFDKFIEARPDQQPWHWKRGIAYYYAGRFADGRRQFEGYQTVDDNDVENAVWRYLCMSRASGQEEARKSLLKIKNDTRVPMMQVYELFAGKIEPADVLNAASAGDPAAVELNNRLFYAHLYLGLYYETLGETKLAQQHLTTAADKHRIGHYMWDIARMHADMLGKPAAK